MSCSSNPSTREEIVSAATDAFLKQLDAGAPPPIESFVSQYPSSMQDVLRKLLPVLALLRTTSGGPGHESFEDGLDSGVRLGDYELLRELGRGGMGVVYEAKQLSLSRHVALKVLPFAATLDKRRIQRFHNESLAAASLDHPNIAEIYGVGCERNVHYYAMRLIDGCSWAEVIASIRRERSGEEGLAVSSPNDAPTEGSHLAANLKIKTPSSFSQKGAHYFRGVVKLVIDVAHALDHAHRQGVIHRDVKPANLMVDEGGKPWVMDFGLAQMNSCDTLTMAGDLIGTLNYMSPEQVASDPIDYRTDVYSLGVTLYEMLTLKRLFDCTSRLEILQSIREEAPRTPSTIDRQIPRELETIVLKSIAKEPANRYATAAAMASDLQCWLDGRPIVARPVGRVGMTWRWCKRNPAVAGMLSAILLLLTSVATISTIAAQRMSQQRDTILSQRNEQSRQRDRALTIIETMTSNLAAEQLASRPNLTDNQKEFLGNVVDLYEEYVSEFADIDVEWDRTTKALHEMGMTLRVLGDNQQAIEAFRRAITLLRRAAAQFPDNKRCQQRLSKLCLALGHAYVAVGEWKNAQECLLQSIDFLEVQHRNADVSIEESVNLVKCLIALADSAQKQGESSTAIAWLESAEDRCQQLMQLRPQTPEYYRLQATICGFRAKCMRLEGRKDETLQAYEQGIAIHEAHASRLTSQTARVDLASLHSGAGNASRSLARYKLSELHHRKSVDVMKSLVTEFPGSPRLRDRLSSSQSNLAVLLIKAGKLDEARPVILSAIANDDEVARMAPEDPLFATGRVARLSTMGKLLQYQQDYAEALVWFERANVAAEALLTRVPGMAEARLFHRNVNWSHAATLDMLQRHEEARSFWEKARSLDERGSQDIEAAQALNRTYLGDFDYGLAEADRLLAAKTTDREVLFDISRIYGLAAKHFTGEASKPYRGKSIQALRQSIENDFIERDKILGEPIYEGVISRTQLRDLVRGIEIR